MRLPQLEGVVERRLLINYRVDADVAARLLPPPFRPELVDGWAVAGICLIRLGQLRPRHVPRALGVGSENAAHRIAVEWDTADGTATGVYVPRRDTASALNRLTGGRIFPGDQHRARFTVEEASDRLRVAFASADGATSVEVEVEVDTASALGPSLLFSDVESASRFFRNDSTAYSATCDCDRFDGLELRTDAWRVEPVRVTEARSSYFDDPHRFPPGSATLDCGLLMRNVPVTWVALDTLGSTSRPIVSTHRTWTSCCSSAPWR